MNIPLDWLKEYTACDSSTAELAHLLSMNGLEVETIERVPLTGGRAAEVMGLNVTPNRGYCLSVIGVAREVAGLLNLPLRLPPLADVFTQDAAAFGGKLTVANSAPDLCLRYAAVMIENVRPGPSPQWLQDKLLAVGLRPLNNIVDITNLVLMEYGQPLHAFDYAQLKGRQIDVRRARAGEFFAGLGGKEAKLDAADLVIADGARPVALAGILGGADSGVTLQTTAVVLESACFDPSAVRQSSKKHGVRTDSSYRFERGVDIDGVLAAQTRAAMLIRELAGGAILPARIDLYPAPRQRPAIRVRGGRARKILGAPLTVAAIEQLFQRLGIDIQEKTGEDFIVQPPTHRPGLTREIDIIEELGRLNGFEKIPVTHPAAAVTPVRPTPRQALIRQLREFMRASGFHENIHYSFIDTQAAERFKSAAGPEPSAVIALSNPLSSDLAVMRTSLLPGLLQAAARNVNKGQKPVKAFETGNVFVKTGDGVIKESPRFAAVAYGPYENDVWKAHSAAYDFYDLKGALEAALAALKLNAGFHRSATAPSYLAGGKVCACAVNGHAAGFLGEIAAPATGELAPPVFAFEIDLDAILQAQKTLSPRFAALPKFPETYRDICLVLDGTREAAAVERLIRETGQPLLQRVELYDHYSHKKLGEGKKSLAFALAFQSPERTLTDEEVNAAFARIVQTLHDRMGAALREA